MIGEPKHVHIIFKWKSETLVGVGMVCAGGRGGGRGGVSHMGDGGFHVCPFLHRMTRVIPNRWHPPELFLGSRNLSPMILTLKKTPKKN